MQLTLLTRYVVGRHTYNVSLGALAQLVERNAGSVEVIGSNPIGSTNYLPAAMHVVRGCGYFLSAAYLAAVVAVFTAISCLTSPRFPLLVH